MTVTWIRSMPTGKNIHANKHTHVYNTNAFKHIVHMYTLPYKDTYARSTLTHIQYVGATGEKGFPTLHSQAHPESSQSLQKQRETVYNFVFMVY